MLAKFFNFIRKPTSKDIIVNTIGNYLNVVFVAFFAFLLVRVLAPSQYGVLSVLLGISYVLANILDFGTTASIYSYLPPMIEKQHKNLYIFLKTIIFYQTVFSALVIGVLFTTFPYLDKIFFKTGAPIHELYLTTFSVLFYVWQNYAINALNASKKFLQSNIYLNLANVIKTVVIIALIPLGMISVGSIIFVFGILGPLVFFLLLFMEKRSIVTKIMKAPIVKSEFRFGYTITFFIASQFFNLALRMDLFLLSYFMSQTPEVGYYGLAQKIILTIITSIASITQVLSPNFSKISTKQDALRELRHGLTYLLMPVALFLILIIMPDWVFNLYFTRNYSQTIVITKSLAIPFIVYVYLNLTTLFLLYTVKKPHYILYANLIVFIIVTIGCYYLIPLWGVFGPPFALGASFLISLIMMGLLTYKEYKDLPSATF